MSLASRLVRAAWPGNIRQLRNLARQLVIGSRGQARLQLDSQLDEALGAPPDAVEPVAATATVKTPEAREPGVARRKPSQVTEAELLAALRASAWDLKAAADALGIPRPSVYDLIDKSPNLRTAGDLGADEITRSFEACGGDLDAMVRELEVSKRALGRRLKELGLVAKGVGHLP